MAKQSGIHQLRGKVGEMSYYRRKGIIPGLVRGINAGMSERVKNDEAFANTRLNNLEFKTANALATFAFNSVNNRKRGMLRDFAISYMTKRALEDVKRSPQAWGYRLPVTQLDVLIADLLENFAKSGKYDGEYGIVTLAPMDHSGEGSIDFDISAELSTSLSDQGIDSLLFVVSQGLAGYNTDPDDLFKLYCGRSILTASALSITAGEELSKSLNFNVSAGSRVGMSAADYTKAKGWSGHGFFAVVSILPVRNIGNQSYILQELCTYVAIPLGQIPTT